MTAIDAWLRRQVEREGRLIALEDALLANRAGAYALYRLRYFSLRCLSSAVLHGIRLTLLQYIFSHKTFLTTLLLNAFASLLTSFWWGALEVLRGRVRRFAHDAERQRVPWEISQWLAIAAVLALVSLVLPAGWIAWQLLHHGRAFNVLHLYVFAICFRLAADFITLTFHSGIYAIRRVYRPLPAMIVVELVSMLVVLALWPWLGRWSFPIAVLLGTTVSAGLVMHYTARLYRFLGWLPLPLVKPDLSSFARKSTLWEFCAAGASYALMKMDAFLMLAMFHSRALASGGVSLFVLFVSVGPAVQAGFDWAQLLYFDLKKLDAACVRAFRRRYEQLAFHLAWVVGLVLWGFACLLGTAIMRRNLGELYWLIGPFFLSRSFLALAQIQTFSRRRYGRLLAGGVLLLGVMLGLQATLPAESYRLLGLALGTVLVAAALKIMLRNAEHEDSDRRVLSLTEWLACVQKVQEPLRVRSLRFAINTEPQRLQRGGVRMWAEEERWRHRRMAQRVAKRIQGSGALALLHPGQVVWYETAQAAARIKDHTLLSWGGGLVGSVRASHFERDGVTALRAALKMGLLAGPLRHTQRLGGKPMQVQEVEKVFSQMIPQGVIYAPDGRGAEKLKNFSSKERRAIFSEAVHFAKHLHGSLRKGRFDVTSLCSNGELTRIFIIDRACDRGPCTRWRARITAMNLASALEGSHQRSDVSRQQEERMRSSQG
jgi:hypothetical protein